MSPLFWVCCSFLWASVVWFFMTCQMKRDSISCLLWSLMSPLCCVIAQPVIWWRCPQVTGATNKTKPKPQNKQKLLCSQVAEVTSLLMQATYHPPPQPHLLHIRNAKISQRLNLGFFRVVFWACAQPSACAWSCLPDFPVYMGALNTLIPSYIFLLSLFFPRLFSLCVAYLVHRPLPQVTLVSGCL